MKDNYLKVILLGIIALNACASNNVLADSPADPRTRIPVGCKLVTGGDNGKVVIPDNVTLVTGGEDCK